MKPTKKHRPALVYGMLGTVYGINAQGEARHFNYDWQAAVDFAGIDQDMDLRFGSPVQLASYVTSGAIEANPRAKTRCFWVKRG